MLRKWRLPAIAGVFVSLLVSAPAVAQDAQMPTVTVAKPVVRDVIDADESSAASRRSTRFRSARGSEAISIRSSSPTVPW